MCQAYEGERAYLAARDLRTAKQKLQGLIDRSKSGDEPTPEEWSTAMANVLIESEN